MGCRVLGRPADGDRGRRGPGGPAAAAAHPLRAGQATRTGDPQGRPGRAALHAQRDPRQARGVPQPVISGLEASARTIATDMPESDGTLEWDSTTIVFVRAVAGEHSGLGYTYGDASIATLVKSKLTDVVCGRDPMDVPGAWSAMRDALRNAGSVGAGAMAISAVDIALWDLKARILGVSLCTLLGRAHEGVEIYGSGGFTSYADDELAEQLAGWAAQAIPRVKMKVGRDPGRDEHRVGVARSAIGGYVELMVDANGAYDRAQARRW